MGAREEGLAGDVSNPGAMTVNEFCSADGMSGNNRRWDVADLYSVPCRLLRHAM
jgi:hypothetical protein